MKRCTTWIVGLGITAALLAAAPAYSQTTLRVGDPYEGTALEFRSLPRMVLIPNTRVYTINDNNFQHDLYRHGGYWYFVDDGNWYRAASWQGPFLYVRTNTVPRDVWNVPTEYRTTWSPTRKGQRQVVTTRSVGERYRGTELTFRTQPRMARIPRTRVDYVRSDWRDGFENDLYRYANRWYYVENGDWYQASSWRGPFYYVRFSDVPRQVRTVPTGYRRAWVTTMTDSDRDWRTERREYRPAGRVGMRYTGNISFTLDGGQPRMAIIPGSSVYYLRDESDADLYRYRDNWYLVDDGVWYRADSWRGPFYSLRTMDVPTPILRIPSGYRKTWVPTSG